jgi:IclR family acetate operon transcriptional repressor
MRHNAGDGLPTSVIGRAAAILGAFKNGTNHMTVAELTRRTGLPKATVHRLVAELASVGLLDRQEGRIRLGIPLFELGQLVPRQRGLREAAEPFLGDLHHSTRMTVHLGIAEEDAVLYISKLPGSMGPLLPSRVGGRLPLHATAIGKALLAFSDAERQQAYLERPLESLTSRTIRMPGVLRRQLGTVRETGTAYEHEESAPGVVCVASPLFGPNGVVLAALSASGWTTQVDVGKVAYAVRTASASLSRQLSGMRSAPLPSRRPG